MGVTTTDIFGTARDARPAAAGPYGERPADWRLPDATRLGRVQLQVADLERSLAFYQGVLGLRVAAHSAATAALSARGDERILVELVERKGIRPARGGRLGLYHFAILLPDRGCLGRFVRHLSGLGIPAGSADHLVSEAIYLHDPNGLGIEIYADRPRNEWRRRGRELMIADGTSMRHDTSLSARASRWSVFSRRAPTPSDRARVEGTTRTSCPANSAASAIPNASLHVSTTTRLRGRIARYAGSAAVRHRRSSTICPSLLRTQI